MAARWIIVAVTLLLAGSAYAGALTKMTPIQAFVPLEVGIQDSCAELCSFIPNGLEADVCTLYCEIKGIDEFQRILQEINPDPIAACMALNVCPTTKYAKGGITALTVTPKSGRQGSTFNIHMQFVITNTTGTGQLLLQINPPGSQGQAFGDESTFQALPPGNYQTSLKVQTQPNQDQPFNPGLYQVIGAICESSCGASNPYAYTIAQGSAAFSISH